MAELVMDASGYQSGAQLAFNLAGMDASVILPGLYGGNTEIPLLLDRAVLGNLKEKIMTDFKIDARDVFYILKEQLDYGKLCHLAPFADLNEKTLDLLVNEAIHFAKGVLDPLNRTAEETPLRFANGEVRCPEAFKAAFEQYGADGWIAAICDPAYGGQGFPRMMRIVINEMMYGACQSFNSAPSLTLGAARLIYSFGSEALKQQYVRKMFAGTWSGTMCLTEPGAGSNLAALETTAYPQGDHFRIRGSKIFISWGQHDLTENIIHLVLARIDGAPQGTEGISLFVVPKIRVLPDGTLGAYNDVVCTGIEHKCGLHAAPTAALTFGGRDGCVGWLCGEANKGLAHMFQMMNGARINSAVSGMTMAGSAYRNALEYEKTRVQGRDIAGRWDTDVAIINHPDVRRMLLWMKAAVDGMRSMIYTTAYWDDLAHGLPAGAEKTHYQNLIDFMTPILKAYCSDTGFRVCETAMQCLGGYGYCRDYPIERYLRDSKIMSLYEGTNGIQSMDLMGRKMKIRDGGCLNAYQAEIDRFCSLHRDHPTVGRSVRQLAETTGMLLACAHAMKARMKSDPLQWASYTYPALLAFGEITMAWRLLDLAVIAAERTANPGRKYDFYRGKVFQATWFAETTLPHTQARIGTCLREGREIVEIPDNAF